MSNMQLGEDTTTMSMTLNPVNEAAFQKAVQSLETLNRAAVFHPTGTGKSCIAWKVVEAHPQTTFFWLVAGAQRLALRQAELTRYNGGTLPGNVRFCDCEKLAAATPEQWVRLGEQKPGCIVLDCYHELSAVCWAQSVQKLLRMCPQAKVLGLGVPNGAPVCAAAQELFADCIVSHMTVAEAMAAGTMPVPSAYAALLWPQEEELATLRARIKNLCMPKGDTSLRVQYEELSWSLRQVENLTVLLPRLLSDTSGHYLVLFESAAYQEKLGAELEQLLRAVDPAVRFYAADHACFADSAAVETFLSDTAPGPKVLLCVNAPGVQQPLEGLAGVILVRQSSLMSTFKQMLCRALVAAGSRSVPVFDLVAQFEGLGNGRTLQRDCTEAMTKAGSKTPGFRQERPMQQTYRLYGKLRREIPGITLRTTLIAGFPGETEEQFEDLCNFVKEVRFDRLGCFAYSAEENTVAAKMDGQIDQETKDRRAELVMQIQTGIMAQKQAEKVGQTVRVLCDGIDEESGLYLCRTTGDAPEVDGNVCVSSEEPLYPGQFYDVLVEDSDLYDLYGTVAK